MIARADISGLVLAGGRGSRMGGVDKGLQLLVGGDGVARPLAQHAVERLAPQVGRVWVSANRNLDAYRGFGVAVVADAPLVETPAADTDAGFAGPLAGVLAGLDAVVTPYLAAVPCDAAAFFNANTSSDLALLNAKARTAVATTVGVPV